MIDRLAALSDSQNRRLYSAKHSASLWYQPPEDKFMNPLLLIRLSTLALALAALGPTASWAQDPSTADHIIVVVPSDLKWADSKATPGAQVAVIEGPANEPVPYILRVKFPADYKIPAHWHPATERVTVLSGTFNLGTGDKLDKEKTKSLTPGSTAIIPPKINHFAWTSEETVIQLNGVGPQDINFVNPEDDPRKK
jgi:quercetin dioxygenase-like cupin family protein